MKKWYDDWSIQRETEGIVVIKLPHSFTRKEIVLEGVYTGNDIYDLVDIIDCALTALSEEKQI